MQGSGSAAQGEISFLSWNSKVQHILASTSYNGTTGEERNPVSYIFLGCCLCRHIFLWFLSSVLDRRKLVTITILNLIFFLQETELVENEITKRGGGKPQPRY